MNKKEMAENVVLEAPSIWLRPALQSGADWIACADRDVRDVFLNELEEGELLALPFRFEFWAMEHQLPPSGDWRSSVVELTGHAHPFYGGGPIASLALRMHLPEMSTHLTHETLVV